MVLSKGSYIVNLEGVFSEAFTGVLVVTCITDREVNHVVIHLTEDGVLACSCQHIRKR